VRRLRALLIRAAGFVFPARRRQEFDDELQSHLDMQVADNLRAGMTVEEARRAALVRFGSLESVREAYRERSSIPVIESSLQDARSGSSSWRSQSAQILPSSASWMPCC
jgi:hypothetical protein